MEQVLAAAASHKSKIDKVYLHVQVCNADAKRFYEANGFVQTSIHESYYKKITPADAWVLEKQVN